MRPVVAAGQAHADFTGHATLTAAIIDAGSSRAARAVEAHIRAAVRVITQAEQRASTANRTKTKRGAT